MGYNKDIDLTLIGNILLADGIGQHNPMIANALYDQLKINIYQLQPKNYAGVSKEVLKILLSSFNGFGKFSLWTFILGTDERLLPVHKSITSPIKAAFSVFESDHIAPLWVKILNELYDLVVVPDQALVPVYQNSGVKIPIFTLPLGVSIERFLARPAKTKANDVFTFGMSGSLFSRKNHVKLLQAFKSKFGNDPKFKLRLHGRSGSGKATIEQAVKEAGCSNVELLTAPLSIKDYDDWMGSLDAYAFPSMGEGYSITPREALACGIPTILSNNSAHQTICNSGFVAPLSSNIKVPANYEVFGNRQIGYYYDCTIPDLAKAMKDVVDNYDRHLERAQGGREWVKQFLWENLKGSYVNLISPKEIVEGKTNLVNEKVFQTNDKVLYKKMRGVFG